MPSTIMFKQNGLPGGSKLNVNNTDAVVTPPNEPKLHLTFHATKATLVGGQVTLSYDASAWYHVAVRPGVYFARIYKNRKWEDYPAQTTGNYTSDKRDAESYFLDIEQILAVS